MNQQWDDIHHSRNQDWKVLVIVIGIFSVLLLLHGKEYASTNTMPLELSVCAAGIIACCLGGCVAFAHWRLFFGKLDVIRQCERAVDIQVNLPVNRIPVQAIIFFTNFFLGSALVGWSAWLTLGVIWIAVALVVATLAVGVWATRTCFHKIVRELDGRATISFAASLHGLPDTPLAATTADLGACLGLLKDRPLKLIADRLRNDERAWASAMWTFSSKDGQVSSKDLLQMPGDQFQFSIASPHSRQTFHKHLCVFEIYISQEPVEIAFRRPGGAQSALRIESGAVLVPPNVEHKVTLQGLTFVVQYAAAGHQVAKDKVETQTAAT